MAKRLVLTGPAGFFTGEWNDGGKLGGKCLKPREKSSQAPEIMGLRAVEKFFCGKLGLKMEVIMEEKPILGMKKLREGAVLPQRQTAGSVGYDLCACMESPVTLQPGEGSMFRTGLAAEIPLGYAGMVFCRSGLGVKHGVTLPNCVGVIDSDYRGELVVPLRNFGEEVYTIQPGERIAQLVIMPVLLPEIVEVDELSQTDRGQGGFGSTGR